LFDVPPGEQAPVSLDDVIGEITDRQDAQERTEHVPRAGAEFL
jgi:hypothetical protein